SATTSPAAISTTMATTRIVRVRRYLSLPLRAPQDPLAVRCSSRVRTVFTAYQPNSSAGN
ncbi:MAG TPA: hypothetical protein VK816_05500, partial [Jatrophihabitantaceae bacterium]|nr:hypothetical protein [Jatrophihabitantaceae bacterium]